MLNFKKNINMKKLLFAVVALVFTSCELSIGDGNNRNVALTDIAIECIAEKSITNNTGSDGSFTKHTYLCEGYVSGYRGICAIRIQHNNFILVDKNYLTCAGDKMQFQLTFAPEWQYLDEQYNTFTVILLDDDDEAICKTSVVVTKHPEAQE